MPGVDVAGQLEPHLALVVAFRTLLVALVGLFVVTLQRPLRLCRVAAPRAVVLLVHLPGVLLELLALPGDVGALVVAAPVTRGSILTVKSIIMIMIKMWLLVTINDAWNPHL